MKIFSFFLLFMLGFPGFSHATPPAPQIPKVPNLINFQAVLRDDSGNLITSNFIDLEFKILDQDGDQLYYEQQPGVQVVRGAVNVMIGEGLLPGSNPAQATTGIPLEALDPSTGAKKLQMKIGNNQPSDPIDIGSTPYSFWSEKAVSVVNNAISSEQIKNASIKLEDLEPNILSFAQVTGQIAESQIPNTVARVTALNAHINSREAHLATAIKLERQLGLGGGSLILEEALRELDRVVFLEIFHRSQNRDTLTGSISTEATTRLTSDTTLTTNLNAHTGATTAHGSNGRIAGLGDITAHAALTTNVHGLTGGSVVGTETAQTLTNKTLTSPVINGGTITGATLSGATITGGTFNGALNNTTGNHNGTIEGIDVSDLNGTVNNHTSPANIAAHSFSNISGTLATSRLSGSVTSIASHGLGSLATLSSVSGGSGGSIADGTITTADLLASAFSSWDQNAGDDFTQTQGDARYSTISHNHDAAYVNVAGGDTMAGPLQVNGNIGVTGTVDGVDVSDLERRVTGLRNVTNFTELEGQIAPTQVPMFMRPSAFGTISFSGFEYIASGYNVRSAELVLPVCSRAGTRTLQVNFATPLSTSNYVVIGFRASGKTTSYFQTCDIPEGTVPVPIDFVVFHP